MATFFSKELFERQHVHAVVLCGGSGTRLWPLSRNAYPKQFLNLTSPTESLLQASLSRLDDFISPNNRWLVLSDQHASVAEMQTSTLAKNMLIEPEPRNTAPAVAWAAWNLLQKDPESTMVVLSSDHAIANINGFAETLSRAVTLAAQDYFVVIGIRPTEPSTGFGYVEVGNTLETVGFEVNSFREKPSEAVAREFMLSGKYLWNAGMFIWKTKTFWQELTKLQPELVHAIEQINENNFEEIYSKLPRAPIDIAFMEKTSHAACVPALFDWSDVGSFAAIKSCFPVDKLGNAVTGDVISIETTNSVVYSSGPLVATAGIDNMVVIATKDAVLVVPADKSQLVKNITDELKKQGRLNLL